MQHVVVDQTLEPQRRVTVAMGANRNLDAGNKSCYLPYIVLLELSCYQYIVKFAARYST